MVFTNPPQPITTLTIPTGASVDNSRLTIGGSIPPLLQAYYQGLPAGVGGTIVAAFIGYMKNTGSTVYEYRAYIEPTIGSMIVAEGYAIEPNFTEECRYRDGQISLLNNNNTGAEVHMNIGLVSPNAFDSIVSYIPMFAGVTGSGGQENWHAATKQNGWGNVAGNVILSYRKLASPPNSIQLTGRMTGGTTTTGITITNLPAGYRPSSGVQFPVTNNGSGNSVVGDLNTAGNFTVNGTFGADLSVNAIIPLDL